MKLFKSHHENGQSLIEMAIAAPILIIFLLGIFEVGAAVRNYLTLVNVNREITRFAVRPGYLDFTSQATVQASYASVRDWASTAVSDQLDLDFTDTGDINNTGNSTLIVSHLVVDTGVPCEDIYDDPDNCDCDAFVDNPAAVTPFTLDDLILHPGMGGQEYQAEQFGPPETVTGVRDTRLDYQALVDELAAQNNQFNCEIIKKGGIPSANNVIVTELFIDQPQFFGFPFISNPYTDPVPLYTHTSMRLVQGARNITYATTGFYCDAFPFVVHKDTIDWHENDEPTPGQYINQKRDIFNGQAEFGTPDNAKGWLSWNPDNAKGSSSTPYLEDSLTSHTTPMNDFWDARVPGDRELKVGSWVASMDGDKAAIEASGGFVSALKEYIGHPKGWIRIPVWDTFDPGGPGQVAAYHIIGFAWAEIVDEPGDINLSGPNFWVKAYYRGDASKDCKGSPPPPAPTGDPPTAVDDTATVVKGGNNVVIPVLANDSDPNGDTLTITDVQWASGGPVRGSWSDNGTTITYTSGTTSGNYDLQYTISDGHGNTATAIVRITVTNS